MTAATPDPDEPPPPQRGLTREERGRDVSEAQAAAETEPSTVWTQGIEQVRRRIAVVNAP
jgi:hypothetical protein